MSVNIFRTVLDMFSWYRTLRDIIVGIIFICILRISVLIKIKSKCTKFKDEMQYKVSQKSKTHP